MNEHCATPRSTFWFWQRPGMLWPPAIMSVEDVDRSKWHPCTNLWARIMVVEQPRRFPHIQYARCFAGTGRARCMAWHHRQHASSGVCRTPVTCGCRKDDSFKRAWRAAVNLCR